MFKVEAVYTVYPIIVESHEIFWDMTAHLGCAVSTWATYAEFTITRENLEIALSYYTGKDFVWLAPAADLLNHFADRYQFLHYEEGTLDTLEEVVF